MTARMLACLRAIQKIEAGEGPPGWEPTANAIADMAVEWDPSIAEPVRRLGNGAVKGSWSGTSARCHRILGTLSALRRQGYTTAVHPRGYATRSYLLPKGEEALREAA